MQEWLDVALDLDEDALAERWDGEIVVDDRLRVLARENHLSLWRSDPDLVDLGDGTAALDLSLHCVAHAHPDCRFRWVRLTLDFADASGVQIADMSPRDEISTIPVTLRTTWSGGLSFEIESLPLAPEAQVERSREQNVYFPKLTASGIRFRSAVWDFTAVGEEPLHVDRDLRLLLSTPTPAATVPVTITLRGHVSVTGLPGTIPLLGRRTSTATVRQAI